MNYNHLTIEERACICKFKEMNMKIREMAKLLDRSPSTISRELKEKLDLLNNRPRKCLNYKTPNELINNFINCCTYYNLSHKK